MLNPARTSRPVVSDRAAADALHSARSHARLALNALGRLGEPSLEDILEAEIALELARDAAERLRYLRARGAG